MFDVGRRRGAPVSLKPARGTPRFWKASVYSSAAGRLLEAPPTASGPAAAARRAVEIDWSACRHAISDISVPTWGGSLKNPVEAAQLLAKDNIECEVTERHTPRPLNDATDMASIARTHRAVIVDKGRRTGRLAATPQVEASSPRS